VRTVAPEVTLQAWVPFRFFPKVAHVEAARLPAIDDILTLCRQAGFHTLHTHTVCRNARVDLQKVTAELRQRKRPSYQLLTEAELDDGLRRIAQEWRAQGGQWIDPKPHVLITGVKQACTGPLPGRCPCPPPVSARASDCHGHVSSTCQGIAHL